MMNWKDLTKNYSLGSSIVRWCNCPKTFLSCCILTSNSVRLIWHSQSTRTHMLNLTFLPFTSILCTYKKKISWRVPDIGLDATMKGATPTDRRQPHTHPEVYTNSGTALIFWQPLFIWEPQQQTWFAYWRVTNKQELNVDWLSCCWSHSGYLTSWSCRTSTQIRYLCNHK